MNILGISAYYHDSAASLVRDGKILFAAQEERFTRIKHDPGFPLNAIRFALKAAGISAADIDLIAFYDKPLVKFERLLESYLFSVPRGLPSFLQAMPAWLNRKLWIPDLVNRELPGFRGRMLFFDHHESHAASAFFPSPFEKAAIITMDGVGEWATTTFGRGEGRRIMLEKEIRFPHSLGLLYSAFTYHLGFTVNSGEYKVMGLAPYGEPRYAGAILENMLDLRKDGSFRMNMEYFDYVAGLTMTSRKFEQLLGGPRREPDGPISQREMDVAASVQAVTEEAMIRIADTAARETGEENLCLAGGVALNCVGNGKLLRKGIFRRIWIQPAAGDAGGALGAALMAWHLYLESGRSPDPARDSQQGSLLGPAFSPGEIGAVLDGSGAVYRRLREEEVPGQVADLLAAGRVVGWFQGRMEFGPRALGARSILADPRLPAMRALLNEKVKFRETFRPFAPAVLWEKTGELFDLEVESPYMLFTARVRDEDGRSAGGRAKPGLPAVMHVDGSARVQTVTREDSAPLFYDTIRSFHEKTGCPAVLNTSFNVRGEPIVCSPGDAYRCFMGTGIDELAIGPFLLRKSDQPAPRETGGRKGFLLD